MSPQNSPEVNVTCNIQPDLIEDHIGTQISVSEHGGLEEEEDEVDIPEPNEADVRIFMDVKYYFDGY